MHNWNLRRRRVKEKKNYLKELTKEERKNGQEFSKVVELYICDSLEKVQL